MFERKVYSKMKRLQYTIKKQLRQLATNDNVLSLTGNLSFAVFGFLSFLILSRLLTIDGFGVWVLFATLATFTDLFRFGLTRSAVVRFAAGADSQEQISVLASSFTISVIQVVLIALIFVPINILWGQHISNDGYKYFFQYYPLLAISNLFWNNALSMLQAKQAFGTILVVRGLVAGGFLILIALVFMFTTIAVQGIIFINIGVNLFASLVCVALSLDGVRYFNRSSWFMMSKIFTYGKYSIGTIAGSSLLRSADAFIIGLSPFLGATGVALYAIPLKLVEVVEVPLRSFCATAFPKMSVYSAQGNLIALKEVFYSYSGIITLALLPILFIVFFWADSFVWMLGGEQFKSSADELGVIMQMFVIYGLLLPIDRLTGVALDSINKPKQNMIKVLWMVVANVVGDCIAVFYFESLVAVALASVVFTFIGIVIGLYYLHSSVILNITECFKSIYTRTRMLISYVQVGTYSKNAVS